MEKECKECGCRDGEMCPQGCHWVSEDLCSACEEELNQKENENNDNRE